MGDEDFSLRDPAGLCDRVPELRALATRSGALRKAIERGRPLAAYRALFWMRFQGAFSADREVIRSLLRSRRLFLARLDGAPAFTINVWQRVAALAILAAVLVGVGSTLMSATHVDVFVVNGLGIATTARLDDGAKVDVPANGRARITTRTGKHTITVTAAADGREIETQPLDVPPRHDVVAWNILGVAPIMTSSVVYSNNGDVPATMASRVGCGVELFLERDVRYVFEEPPDQAGFTGDKDSEERRVVSVPPAKPGECVQYLAFNGQVADARKLAIAEAQALDSDAPTLRRAQQILIASGDDAGAENLVRDSVSRHPGSVEHHLVLQDTLRLRDKPQELLAEYKERYDRDPESADAAYLYARLLQGGEARSLFDDLAARFPEHALIVRGVAHCQMIAGDAATAAASYARTRKLDEKIWLESAEQNVEVLVASGHEADARALLGELLGRNDLNPYRQRMFSVQRLELANLTHEDKLDVLMATLPRPQGLPQASALLAEERLAAGAPISIDELGRALSGDDLDEAKIVFSARTDPVAALALVGGLAPEASLGSPASVALLLYGEASRLDAAAAVRNRLSPFKAATGILTQIHEYVSSGKGEPAIADLDPEERAALHFIRSRAVDLPPAERKRLVALARSEDVFHGPITLAIDAWPQ